MNAVVRIPEPNGPRRAALVATLSFALTGCLGLQPTGGDGTGGTPDGAGGNTGGPGTGGRGTGGVTGVGGRGAGGGVGGSTDGGARDAARNDGGDAAAVDAPRADASSDARDGALAGDGPATFVPCPTNQVCIVMPLGDSITEGFPDLNGGYRVELFNQAVLAGKGITFVGRRANGPATVDNRPFPRGSEGYSGYTIADAPTIMRLGLSPTLVEPAIAMFHPHIILLMIGTNDVNQSLDLANAPTRLGALLDRITTAAPAALLVVAKIIPTRTDTTNVRINSYNAAIPALVQQRVASGKHILLLDNYAVFAARADYKTALLVDDLHPNLAGYALLGQTWFAAISTYLPAAP